MARGGEYRRLDIDAHIGHRGTRDFEILMTVARSLLETSDLDDQLTLTLTLAIAALGANRGSVMMTDPEAEILRIRAAVGLPAEAAERAVPFGEGIAGWVAAHNQPLVLHGDVADPRFEGSDPTIESSLSLPLSVGQRVLGVLNLVRQPGERFTDDDLRLASSLADMAAIAIEKARLYAALREREERVSALLGAAINAQEQERRRLAADIHDGFLQDLSALFLSAEAARMHLARSEVPDAAAKIAEIQEMVRQEVEQLREYIFEVRPVSLDEIGLGPTLRSLVDRIAAAHSLEGSCHWPADAARLSDAVETILYRTAQEAVRNVAKHAQATWFSVLLELGEGEVTLRVLDDGRGFDPETEFASSKGHYGIATMRERVELAGGRFDIGPRRDRGTEVVAVIPF